MADVVTMPKLGFDMAEGTLVKWVILENEEVAAGAVLAEIETDKATVEVESEYSGILVRHLVSEGSIVPVNLPIAVIASPGEEVDFDALLGEQPVEAAQAPAGEAVQPEVVKTVEPAAVPEGGDVNLPDGVRASPLAKRIARDMGVNLKLVTGSGPGGRITKKDVEAYLTAPAGAEAKVEVGVTPAPAAGPISVPPITQHPVGAARPDTVIPINRLRAAIGRRMTEVKQTVPHFYVTHEYDMAPVMALRKQVNAMLEGEEKLSVNDFIVKAVALTLRQFPNLNASLKDDSIVQHGHVNVGVAVAVEGGLLTVVCKDTDLKSMRQISMEVRGMAARARDGKVKPDDIEGSTFSVSNLGMFDVENFIAILNPPEAAILAVGSALEVPVVRNGEIVPGYRMKATISVDHRVSDGAEAARFLQALEVYLVEPVRLML